MRAQRGSFDPDAGKEKAEAAEDHRQGTRPDHPDGQERCSMICVSQLTIASSYRHPDHTFLFPSEGNRSRSEYATYWLGIGPCERCIAPFFIHGFPGLGIG